MATTKKSQAAESSNGGKRHSIVDIPVAEPLSVPTVVLYAARTAGKSKVLEALTTINEKYYAVQSWAPSRGSRSGESLKAEDAREQISRPITIDDLVDSPLPFVLGYHEDNQMYAYPADGFDAKRIPVVRVIGQGALNMLEEWGTLPNKLKIHLTLDARDIEDITERAISRMIRKEILPKEFKQTEETSDDVKNHIAKRVAYVRERVDYFREQTVLAYHATFDNSVMSQSDPRQLLYDQKPESIVLTDIALRINELYYRWLEGVIIPFKTGIQVPMNALDLHHAYITDVCVHLFGRGTQTQWKPNKEKFKMKGVVVEYASIRDIDEERLREKINRTRVAEVDRNLESGRFSVYLQPTDGPIHFTDIENHSSLDFETLGYLAYCAALGDYNAAMPYGPRPTFEFTSDGIIRGAIWSLTDIRPTQESKDKGRIRYHELFVGYKH